MPRRNTPAKPNGAGGGRHRPTPELDRYLQPQPGAETVRQRSSAMLPRAPLLCPAAAGCMAMLLRPGRWTGWRACTLHLASLVSRGVLLTDLGRSGGLSQSWSKPAELTSALSEALTAAAAAGPEAAGGGGASNRRYFSPPRRAPALSSATLMPASVTPLC